MNPMPLLYFAALFVYGGVALFCAPKTSGFTGIMFYICFGSAVVGIVYEWVMTIGINLLFPY